MGMLLRRHYNNVPASNAQVEEPKKKEADAPTKKVVKKNVKK